MSAAIKDLIIDQGSDWFLTLIYKESTGTVNDLTDFNANLQLRTSYDAGSASLTIGTGYLGVKSTTSDAIGTGSAIFTVSSTSAFTVGTRVRAASAADPTKFQEGAVASIVTNTSVTVTVDLIGGSGTVADWVFSSAVPKITITPLAGKIDIHATATQTGALTAGEYVYDLELTSPSGIVTRVIQGRATVRPQVTR